MKTVEKVRCPNCGSHASRLYHPHQGIVQTECSVCDYLLVHSDRTCQVVEAYAPGIAAR